jgi:carboxymethylenebutenolidase
MKTFPEALKARDGSAPAAPGAKPRLAQARRARRTRAMHPVLARADGRYRRRLKPVRFAAFIRLRRELASAGNTDVIEQTIDITTEDGAMETFVCHPERGGPHPAVMLLMDAPGVREELRDMARRLGTVGCYVLLPNLYYRAGRDTIYGPDVLQHGSAEHARMRAVRTKMTIPPVMADIGAMLSFIDRQDAAKPGPVGAHGYCMSGPYALAAAARYPDRIPAAASFYGTWLINEAEESPHLNLGKIKGEVYIACAEHDDLAPLPMVEELRGLFRLAGTAGEIELYPGVHHGFAFPQRWCYDKPAAERHWERLIALYRRRLG